MSHNIPSADPWKNLTSANVDRVLDECSESVKRWYGSIELTIDGIPHVRPCWIEKVGAGAYYLVNFMPGRHLLVESGVDDNPRSMQLKLIPSQGKGSRPRHYMCNVLTDAHVAQILVGKWDLCALPEEKPVIVDGTKAHRSEAEMTIKP